MPTDVDACKTGVRPTEIESIPRRLPDNEIKLVPRLSYFPLRLDFMARLVDSAPESERMSYLSY